jgi:hypothetical protein
MSIIMICKSISVDVFVLDMEYQAEGCMSSELLDSSYKAPHLPTLPLDLHSPTPLTSLRTDPLQ